MTSTTASSSTKKAKTHLDYIISLGLKNYQVNPDIFAKMSTRFAEIRKTKPNNFRVKETIPQELFDIFVDACQLKNFDVQKSNVFQLLDLAKDWGVASLERYLSDYAMKRNLVRKEIADYVGVLLEHIANNTDNYVDWTNVGHILSEVLDDPRLLEIPPEIFTRILTVAEKTGFELVKENRQKLIDFTMKLLEAHPESAVPLILRLDFSLLTPEQLDKIYQCPQLHSQNIGFFLESALSALVNKVNVNFETHDLLNRKHIQSIIIDHKKMMNERTEKLNKVFDRQCDDIIDEIDRQQDLLDELGPQLEAHIQRIETAEKKAEPKKFVVSEEFAEDVAMRTEETLKKMTEDVNKDLSEHLHYEFSKTNNMAKISEDYFIAAAKESTNPYEVQRFVAEDLIKFGEQIEEHQNQLRQEMTDVWALIAAKIVRDKIRFDQFLRRTTGKYKVFDEKPLIWGLGQARVKETDKRIELMERKLDELCPTRDHGK